MVLKELPNYVFTQDNDALLKFDPTAAIIDIETSVATMISPEFRAICKKSGMNEDVHNAIYHCPVKVIVTKKFVIDPLGGITTYKDSMFVHEPCNEMEEVTVWVNFVPVLIANR